MAKNEGKKGKDRLNKCPLFPPGWTGKFTGPHVNDNESVASANLKWAAFLRMHRKVIPCPRRRFEGLKAQGG